MTMKILNSSERRFFSLVHQAVLTNPFSDERMAIDRKITGLFSENISKEDQILRTIEEVRNRVQQFKKNGRLDFHDYDEEDRIILRSSLLFDFFHLFLDQFDQLIMDQLKVNEQSVKVSFADQAFQWLYEMGFNKNESLHYFALAFQLRRAFFFIDRALVGSSPIMKKLRQSLWNNIFTHNIEYYHSFLWNRMEDFSTVIMGSTGTGKGTAAAAIGRSGFIPFDEHKQCFKESFTQSFIALNLSQFSETLIESELFGHKKGAFTGAVEDHKGILSNCSPFGAIFLDEIGEVSASLQIKLLKVLEERIFFPVGSHKETRFNGRIIAATNRSIDELMNGKRLREDFFYRLCSDLIVMPTLSQRIQEDPEELNVLIEYSIQKIIGKHVKELVELVKNVIDVTLGKQYPWPGNVRELTQCIRSILLNRTYHSPHHMGSDKFDSSLAIEINKGEMNVQTLIMKYCHMLYERCGNYGEVARLTQLDRRTVTKYVKAWEIQIRNSQFSPS
ncbi:MAG: sigma-54-dependent Fis family transcriptional regulator [Desulfobacterales bacterium]|nr:sigma-54-dependent Fis family transcriptional regulator [Desulfobacterales bacterium]